MVRANAGTVTGQTGYSQPVPKLGIGGSPRFAATQAMVDFRPGTMRQVKIIVEKHADGYVAYPLGLKGIVVGEGSGYEEALADVRSAIRFHIETFGSEVL